MKLDRVVHVISGALANNVSMTEAMSRWLGDVDGSIKSADVAYALQLGNLKADGNLSSTAAVPDSATA